MFLICAHKHTHTHTHTHKCCPTLPASFADTEASLAWSSCTLLLSSALGFAASAIIVLCLATYI